MALQLLSPREQIFHRGNLQDKLNSLEVPWVQESLIRFMLSSYTFAVPDLAALTVDPRHSKPAIMKNFIPSAAPESSNKPNSTLNI